MSTRHEMQGGAEHGKHPPRREGDTRNGCAVPVAAGGTCEACNALIEE